MFHKVATTTLKSFICKGSRIHTFYEHIEHPEKNEKMTLDEKTSNVIGLLRAGDSPNLLETELQNFIESRVPATGKFRRFRAIAKLFAPRTAFGKQGRKLLLADCQHCVSHGTDFPLRPVATT